MIGLAQQFEVLGPVVVEAIAAKGFDVFEDVKAGSDLKALFA
jgi:hypothetical protein